MGLLDFINEFYEEPFGHGGPSVTDIQLGAAVGGAALLTGGASVAGGLALAGGTTASLAGSRNAERAQRAYNRQQADLLSQFEMPSFEMPSFDFNIPPPPKPQVRELPKPPKPPTRDAAASMAQSKSQMDRERRRTISLFESSAERAGRSSTILTSSLGAPGSPPVRRRQLGGAESLLGSSV